MKRSKVVLVVHPESQTRVLLRSTLEAQGYTVATDHCCRDLLRGQSELTPDLILLDRSLVAEEGLDILSELTRKWKDAENVFLPEGLLPENSPSRALSTILGIVDRLLNMETTRELLAV